MPRPAALVVCPALHGLRRRRARWPRFVPGLPCRAALARPGLPAVRAAIAQPRDLRRLPAASAAIGGNTCGIRLCVSAGSVAATAEVSSRFRQRTRVGTGDDGSLRTTHPTRCSAAATAASRTIASAWLRPGAGAGAAACTGIGLAIGGSRAGAIQIDQRAIPTGCRRAQTQPARRIPCRGGCITTRAYRASRRCHDHRRHPACCRTDLACRWCPTRGRLGLRPCCVSRVLRLRASRAFSVRNAGQCRRISSHPPNGCAGTRGSTHRDSGCVRSGTHT